eukprot:gene19428-26086_t
MAGLSVDDLLKELDDLPGTSNRLAQSSKPAPPSSSAAKSAPPAARSNGTQGRQTEQQQTFSYSKVGSVSGSSRSQNPPINTTQTRTVNTPTPSRKTSEVDDLLADFDDITGHPPLGASGSFKSLGGSSSVQAKVSSSTSSAAPAGGRPKCMGVFLGGSHLARGRNGAAIGSIICCDSLRCTKCDFKVLSFSNMKWSPSVDYLFFRNNYPTEKKLVPMLASASGAFSYCCQCSWVVATKAERQEGFAGELRWLLPAVLPHVCVTPWHAGVNFMSPSFVNSYSQQYSHMYVSHLGMRV